MFVPRYSTEEGFTLLELAVVVLIMGVLLSIAVPALLNQRKSVLDNAVKSDTAHTAQLLTIEAMEGKKVTSVLTFTEDGVTGEAGTLDTTRIRLSEDSTTLIVQPSRVAGGLCLFGINPEGKESSEVPGIVFDSLAGGLISTTGASPVACADEFGNLNVPQDAINNALYSR